MTRLIIWILNQFKDYSLCTAGASLMKRDAHQRLIVVCIYCKNDEIQFRGYLFMANCMDCKSIQRL